jgi:hypothetical protein
MLFLKTESVESVNKNLEAALSQSIGKNYNSQIGIQVVNAVHNSVMGALEVLGITADKILPEAKIIENLGAESIEGLDIYFRIEKEIGIKIAPYCSWLITEGNTQQTVLGLAKIVYNDYIKQVK